MHTKTKKEEKQDQALVPVKQDAETLIALAIEKNVPVETMERLLAMRRELKAERTKEAFDKAMSAFQAECPIIKKTKGVTTDSDEVAFKYAPLECIVEQVKEFLSKNGFSYSVDQSETEPGYIKVALTVKHTLGHYEVTSVRLALGNKTRLMSQTQVEAATLLKIDTLCREGFYLRRVMRFFQPIFAPKNIPQVEQNNSGHIEEL